MEEEAGKRKAQEERRQKELEAQRRREVRTSCLLVLALCLCLPGLSRLRSCSSRGRFRRPCLSRAFGTQPERSLAVQELLAQGGRKSSRVQENALVEQERARVQSIAAELEAKERLDRIRKKVLESYEGGDKLRP